MGRRPDDRENINFAGQQLDVSEFLSVGLTVEEGEEEAGQVGEPRLFCRAGHFRYFLIFSLIENDFLYFLSS